jgi:hypothetical protein
VGTRGLFPWAAYQDPKVVSATNRNGSGRSLGLSVGSTGYRGDRSIEYTGGHAPACETPVTSKP